MEGIKIHPAFNFVKSDNKYVQTVLSFMSTDIQGPCRGDWNFRTIRMDCHKTSNAGLIQDNSSALTATT
jgi:hypothetical protein